MTKPELLTENRELRKLVDLHRQMWHCADGLLEIKEEFIDKLYEVEKLFGEYGDVERRRG